LLSGGLDSATALAIARSEGFGAYAISFRYGQRHSIELESARNVAGAIGVEQHLIVDIDLRSVGGSALTDNIDVPRDRTAEDLSAGIPVTYVPARNTIFLSLALAFAEVLEAGDLFLGANAIDYSGYPDCRPEYLRAFEALANLATRAAVEGRRLRVHAPLLERGKGEIVRLAIDLGVDLAQTLSCYDPTPAGAPCGACDACVLRRRGFEDAGVPDPGNLPPDRGRG